MLHMCTSRYETRLHDHHTMSSIWQYPFTRPQTALFVLFVAWKAALLILAACAPGPGYDTSTALLLTGDRLTSDGSWASVSARHLLLKLTRWDAIYFSRIASRGYVFEQEWAFGWGFLRLLGLIATGTSICGDPQYVLNEARNS